MGMFDEIRCKYPLPVDGANALLYQTKDTPNQYLNLYEIREDGTLWFEEYDIEDKSVRGKLEKENPGKSVPQELENELSAWIGCNSRVNRRFVQLPDYRGEIRFYAFWDDRKSKGWIEWSALFKDGKLIDLKLLRDEKP